MCLGTHPRFSSFSSLFLPHFSATDGPIFTGMEAMMLARLPFRLGLGRVLDAIDYLQAS
jgi:hypothetical protein